MVAKKYRNAPKFDVDKTMPAVPRDVVEQESERQRNAILAVENIRKGVLPTNDVIVNFLEHLLNSEAFSSSKIEEFDPASQDLINDIKNILKDTGDVVREKNDDEKLQRFIYHSRLATDAAIVELQSPKRISFETPTRTIAIGTKHSDSVLTTTAITDQAKKDIDVIYKFLRLILSSTEFRAFMSESQSLLVAIMRDESMEEKTDQMNEYETAAIWKEGKRTILPIILDEEGSSSSSANAERGSSENVFSIYGPKSKNDNGIEVIHKSMHEKFDKKGGLGKHEKGLLTPRQSNVDLEKLPIMEDVEEKLTMNERPMGEMKGSKYAKFDKQILSRLRVLFQDLARQPGFSDLIVKVSYIFQKLRNQFESHGNDEPKPDILAVDNEEIKDKSKKSDRYFSRLFSKKEEVRQVKSTIVPPTMKYDANLKQTVHDLKTIMESFIGGYSLDPFLRVLNELNDAVKHDYALKDFFGDWSTFIQHCVSNPSYMNNMEYYTRGQYLLRRGRAIKSDPEKGYIELFGKLRTEYNYVLESFRRDEVTQKIVHDVEKLFRDLPVKGLNMKWSQTLQSSVIPMLLNQIKYIPIPRIESTDHDYDVVLENIILSTDNLVPKIFDITSTKHLLVVRNDATRDNEWMHGAVITLAAMRIDLQNVDFSYRKKTGIKVVDRGKIDFKIYGQGLTILMDISRRPKKEITESTYILNEVGCWIDKMDLKIFNSKHQFLYGVFGPMIKSRIKKEITEGISRQIMDSFKAVDSRYTIARSAYKGKKTVHTNESTILKSSKTEPHLVLTKPAH